ncbi:3,4-dihydroxy-2-butanone 4-phosphate synthase [Microdochium trichocladiopsis]|uniref:3,4-dihydroxy-2-butanone 4-phosphate synthase n=1 Tax=Microdochium trichocladiopsis TaxID=1682393 RepID=A0A9P8Y3W6_9PEZI|nr:3,4-dihydroxy-2-butanone 4-phosphate synthase [Microdochium trichocladiopsis]KAH7028049.1 3,4-dihydroxy-2-butanone 4-phosphate synthase [Microdochium trichocladiopsis]
MPSSTIDHSQFDSIPDTVAAFKNGEFIVVLDDADRENEGDLIIAADSVTTEQMAFMIRHSSGLICAPITPQLTEHLALPQMVSKNQDSRTTAYTISVDAADSSVTTGISAHDRALTVRLLADPKSTVETFVRPGHVFPLRARPGGVRVRRGHTEAAVDFCRLAGKPEAAAISELVEDGEVVEGQALHKEPGMMRAPACIAFARRWGLKVCTIEDLVKHIEKVEGPYQAQANGGSS